MMTGRRLLMDKGYPFPSVRLLTGRRLPDPRAAFVSVL
jgi:hypothetical protein